MWMCIGKALIATAIVNSVMIPCAWAGASTANRKPVTAEDVRRYLRSTYTVAAGSDAFLDGALSSMFSSSGTTWLEIFKLVLTADNVAKKLSEKDYQMAVLEAARYPVERSIASTLAGSAVTSAYAIASLGAIPIELGLKNFADTANRAGLNQQIGRYFSARDAGMPHDYIVSGQYGDQYGVVFYEDGGWILFVNDTGMTNYKPQFPSRFTSKQVFDLARQLYDARSAADQLVGQKQELEREFGRILERQGIAASSPAATCLAKQECGDAITLDGANLEIDRIGPIRVGMTLTEASKAARLQIKSEGKVESECEYAAAPGGPPGLGFFIVDQRIALIQVSDGPIATSTGIRVGDLDPKVLQAYKGGIEDSGKSRAPDEPRLFRIRSKDQFGARLELTIYSWGGKVDLMAAGRPIISQIGKGCQYRK